MKYAEILIWNGSARHLGRLTYENEIADLKEGDIVTAPFRNTTVRGWVRRMHNETPTFKTQKLSKKADMPGLEAWQIELAEWMIEYYFCSEYDAFKTVTT